MLSQDVRLSSLIGYMRASLHIATNALSLGWDSKLQSFFTLANMPTSFSDAPNLDAAEIVGMVTATLEDGVSTKDHARMLGGAWDGVDRLLSHAKGSGAE